MEPKKFRKKPVEIEAIQFNGNNFTQILLWMGMDEKKVQCSAPPRQAEFDKDIPNESYSMIIPTLEGEHIATKMDWIIKGVKGEFYPCKPDIFELTYVASTPTNQQGVSAEEFYKEYVKGKGKGAITLNVIEFAEAYHNQASGNQQRVTDEELKKKLHENVKKMSRSFSLDDINMYELGFLECIDRLSQLPEVKTSNIERETVLYHQGYSDGFVDGERKLPEGEVWISVKDKDKLPKEGLRVLVHIPSMNLVTMGWRHNLNFASNDRSWAINGYLAVEVIEWQPLPEPPNTK